MHCFSTCYSLHPCCQMQALPHLSTFCKAHFQWRAVLLCNKTLQLRILNHALAHLLWYWNRHRLFLMTISISTLWHQVAGIIHSNSPSILKIFHCMWIESLFVWLECSRVVVSITMQSHIGRSCQQETLKLSKIWQNTSWNLSLFLELLLKPSSFALHPLAFEVWDACNKYPLGHVVVPKMLDVFHLIVALTAFLEPPTFISHVFQVVSHEMVGNFCELMNRHTLFHVLAIACSTLNISDGTCCVATRSMHSLNPSIATMRKLSQWQVFSDMYIYSSM